LALETVLKRLGQRLRELRIQRGFTSQEKFADYLGVNRSFMGHVKTGRRDFRLSTVIRLADALGVPVADLFLEPGTGAGGQKHSRRRKLVVDMERKRIPETAAMLESAARTLGGRRDGASEKPFCAKANLTLFCPLSTRSLSLGNGAAEPLRFQGRQIVASELLNHLRHNLISQLQGATVSTAEKGR
jgi:transcriptional regulator with XRE-family HTH domain